MNSYLASCSTYAYLDDNDDTQYTSTNSGSSNNRICHPSEIERPSTPSPDSIAFYQTSLGRTPRNEMEPLDQMIYDLEVERLTKLELPHDKEDTVTTEFDRRQWLTELDRDIHHYNWFGQAVYEASSTLAEHSLVVLMTKPKFASRTENPWLFSVLNRAYLYIDPVIVDLDIPERNDLLEHLLRGSSLEYAMKGSVVKYYTPHGLWMSDPSMAAERIEIDYGDVADYIMNYGIGNGFIDQGYITSWAQWQANYNRARFKAEAPKLGPRKKLIAPSPLRQVMIAGAINSLSRRAGHHDLRASNGEATSSKTKRVRFEPHIQVITRSQTMCNVQPISSSHPISPARQESNDIDWISATDPETYYSFPFPGPGRRDTGVKDAFRKASKSALSYLRCGSVDGVE